MDRINRKQFIYLFDETDKKFIACNKNNKSISISPDLDTIKDLCKNNDVKIYRYYDKEEQELSGDTDAGFIFKSTVMHKTMRLVKTVAATDATVLIQGETGTGKSFIARMIHMNSERKDKSFMDINCAAISEKLLESELFGYEGGSFTGALDTGKEGLFETAKGGTVFLDEINSLPMSLQVKFLRVIQEKEVMRVGGSSYIPVDVRILVASNAELMEEVEKGNFREDLYYRLNIVPVTVSPLRSRKEDIRAIGEFFFEQYNRLYNQNKYICEEAWKDMEKYKWPGNVRELQNMIERLSIVTDNDRIERGDIIDLFMDIDIESQFRSSIKMTLKEELDAYEKKIIEARMNSCKTTKEVAETLGIDKSTLTRKIKRLGIKR